MGFARRSEITKAMRVSSPARLLSVAQSFAGSAAALALAARSDDLVGASSPDDLGHHSPSFYLLHGVALELALKAVVLAGGGTQGEIERLRHELERAYNRALDCGFRPTEGEALRRVLAGFHGHHMHHHFRYFPAVRAIVVPDAPETIAATDRLLDDVGDFLVTRGVDLASPP